MKTGLTKVIRQRIASGALTLVAGLALLITGSAMAQTYTYSYSGSEQTLTLQPGTYDITAYGAAGGSASSVGGYSGGLGAEMEAQFNFSTAVNLTILVGGSGGGGYSGGGGGGSFVVNGSTPLVIAGGGGGGGTGNIYGGGGGGGGGGGYSGGGGGWGGHQSSSGGYGGGGGGSYIDASGTPLTEVSGVQDLLQDGNGEVIIQTIPEPSTWALVSLGLSALLVYRRRKA